MKIPSYDDKYNFNLEPSVVFTNRLNDLKSEIKVQLPCKVQSVNHQTNQVDVEILDYSSDEEGNLVNYPIIPNVPIRQPMDSANAYIRLPIQVGDIGTIEFFDSSVADVLITNKYDYDYSEDWHSLNNGLFTNGFLPKGKLFEFDQNSKIVIGTKTGKFTFKITANDELIVEAPSIDIKSDGGINITTPDVSVSGDVTVGSGASGTVACQNNVITITNGIVTGIE